MSIETTISNGLADIISHHLVDFGLFFTVILVVMGILVLVKLLRGMGAVLGALLMLFILLGVYVGAYSLGFIDQSLPNPITTVQQVQNFSQNMTIGNNTQNSPDLRSIAAPYLSQYNISASLCTQYGGTLHNESNWIGCEGIGYYDCASLSSLATACENAGANWTCTLTDIYCKI